jgi:hypothetical protein
VGILAIPHLGAIYCASPIRRLTMWGQQGFGNNKRVYMALNDLSIFTGMSAEDKYLRKFDYTHFSEIYQRNYADPSWHWTVPVVSGHNYRVVWDQQILDWTRMRFGITQYLWDSAGGEGDIVLEMPFKDYSEGVTVTDEAGLVHTENSLTINRPKAIMGDYNYKNEIDPNFATNPSLANTVYKEKLVELNISGDTPEVNSVTVETNGCVDDCDFVQPIGGVGSGGGCTSFGLWSDPATWAGHFTTERIPEAGDYVNIHLGMCVILDIHECDMPRLQFVEINGRLTSLDDGTPRALRASNIWVRAGLLEIGTPEVRYSSRFTIELLNGSTDDNWRFSSNVAVGTKALVVTGTLSLHGPVKNTTKTRLVQSISSGDIDSSVGDTKIYLESTAGIVGKANADSTTCRSASGDLLAVASSNMDTKAIEFCEAKTVAGNQVECIANNGLADVDYEFTNFHFGSSTSTANDWGGIDMRSEVTVLSRMITIKAETDYINYSNYTGPDTEAYGCRILVADWFDTGAGGIARRTGNISLDYVEVKMCSQKHTEHPALKFEGAKGVEWGSRVEHSVLHNGNGTGIIIENSQNVTLIDNAVVSFVRHGILVEKSSRIHLESNWVHHVIPPDWWFSDMGGPEMHKYTGWTGAFTLSNPSNSRLVVINNVASGSWHHGFHYKPLKCDDNVYPNNPGTWFQGNVAHSISGYGAVASNIEEVCTEVKNFAAYKVT